MSCPSRRSPGDPGVSCEQQRLRLTDPVHDGRPSLVRDNLEDGKHCQTEVVEVSDPVVRSFPVAATDVALELFLALEAVGSTRMGIRHHFAWKNRVSSCAFHASLP